MSVARTVQNLKMLLPLLRERDQPRLDLGLEQTKLQDPARVAIYSVGKHQARENLEKKAEGFVGLDTTFRCRSNLYAIGMASFLGKSQITWF